MDERKKWRSVQEPRVITHPNDYFWIYDLDTFQGEKWNTESIDALVKEMRPSRDCLKQLLESYEDDDRKTKKEKWDRRWETIKSSPERFHNWLEKYKQIWWFVTTFIAGVLGALLTTSLIN